MTCKKLQDSIAVSARGRGGSWRSTSTVGGFLHARSRFRLEVSLLFSSLSLSSLFCLRLQLSNTDRSITMTTRHDMHDIFLLFSLFKLLSKIDCGRSGGAKELKSGRRGRARKLHRQGFHVHEQRSEQEWWPVGRRQSTHTKLCGKAAAEGEVHHPSCMAERHKFGVRGITVSAVLVLVLVWSWVLMRVNTMHPRPAPIPSGIS